MPMELTMTEKQAQKLLEDLDTASANKLCECCGHKRKVHSEFEWPPVDTTNWFVPTMDPSTTIRPPRLSTGKRWRCHFLITSGYRRYDRHCPCDFFVPIDEGEPLPVHTPERAKPKTKKRRVSKKN